MYFTLFDVIISTVLIFFILLGISRGLVKEITSLISWCLSILFTVFLRPYFNILFSSKVQNKIILNFTTSAIIFIVSIIFTSILLLNLSKLLNQKIPMSINITLGFAFGFIKGFLISSMLFSIILNMYGDINNLSTKTGPKWLQDSIFYRPLSFGAYIILPITNSFSNKIEKKYNDDKLINEMIENFEMKDKLEKKIGNDNYIKDEKDNEINIDKKKEEEIGYKKEQQKSLNRLIEVIE